MSDNRKLKWLDGGNYKLDNCQTEKELSDKLDEVLSGLSEQFGQVIYHTDDGKQYVVGLTMTLLEIEGETEGVILN